MSLLWDLVKNAFTRVFSPISNPKQIDFIKNKIDSFAYGFDLAKGFQFSFCSTCNSSYQRLSDKKSKSNKKVRTSENVIQLEKNIEIINVESTTEISQESTMSDGSTFYNKSKCSNLETENEDSTELEIEVNYKLSIKKADGTSLPAKNYSVIISELDEFLLSIQNNITALLKDEKIDANDYNVSFKSEKTQGAGTLLVDVRDFENFKSEYTKLVAAKKVMLISITMNKKEKQVDETTSDDDIDHDEDSIPNIYNKNKVPKISDISLLDQRIGKNVTELRRETWCSMHNRHCLKDREPHVEISNMMFSTWATEMLNGLASVKDPPTHPLFAYTKNRSQHTLPQVSNDLQNSISPFFSNLFQALVAPQLLQQQISQQSPLQSPLQTTLVTHQSLPSMIEFLQQLDEAEETGDYYVKFLEGFEKQRVRVKHLYKLNDTQFEACGVTTIGDIETIRDAAKKYK
ncbi:hypothetical protein GLOIN_2v1844088 [Rhizophagus clarus]|uniref:SAM domain-containing protein n=1 Tax=Rhizophagus clarus TaxID=94130 RepID=A0A8H3QCE5_9GLOM|nr:hypothetical protein GLOIN_2v1844088 [Rhizophagus clarus]